MLRKLAFALFWTAGLVLCILAPDNYGGWDVIGTGLVAGMWVYGCARVIVAWANQWTINHYYVIRTRRYTNTVGAVKECLHVASNGWVCELPAGHPESFYGIPSNPPGGHKYRRIT